MKRSFAYSLRPKVTISSTNPNDENPWSLTAAITAAREGTRTISINFGKSAELFIDSSLRLSEADIEKIVTEVGENKTSEPENRSVSFELTKPVSVSDKLRSHKIVSLQIKGIVFDSRVPTSIYGGAGWPREYFFGNQEGRVCRYEALKENAIGYCSLQEAVSEFLMCRELRTRLSSTDVGVPYPVGWGQFEKTDNKGSQFGFVILGHPKLIPNREEVYLKAVDKLAKTNDFNEVDKLLSLRAQSIREVNRGGAAVHGRHFGNLSFMPSGHPYIHDLGTPTSLTREHMYNDKHFLAETFAQLVYAMTPRKIVVPVPNTEGSYRSTVMNYLDEYTQTTLATYYENDPRVSQITFEDFEETFFAALHEPIMNLKLTPAVIHCEVVGRWLADYRQAQP